MRRPVITLHGVPRKPTVYFAGKISLQDWRGRILGPHRPGGEDYYGTNLWDPHHRIDHATFFYGGPFFASCDHGCGHAPFSHGSNQCGPTEELDELHEKVWDVNCARLQMADVVFAFVNETDCFGTMVEVGIAAAHSKPVFVALGPNLTGKQCADLWMLQMPAVKVYRGGPAFTWRLVCKFLGLTRPAAVALVRL